MTNPKYMRPGLHHALGKVTEELGEITEAIGRLGHAIGKTIRFGPASANPELPPHQQETNADWMLREIMRVEEEHADLIGALANLRKEILEWEVRIGKNVT